MTMFEILEAKEIVEFAAYIIIAFALGGIIVASVLSAQKENVIQATPIQMPGYDVLALQQQAWQNQNSECNVCLKDCFRVFNDSRNFGRLVVAVESGLIK